jgi:hypothetical protein
MLGPPIWFGPAAVADCLPSTDVGAELILIDIPLEFESVGVWAGD